MDLSDINTRLHPGAKDFLFQHYSTLYKIFRDVLGHLGIEYMAIALLNSHREWFFFSSRPSIEYNLIEKKLWQFDAIYQEDFFKQKTARFWSDLYSVEWGDLLHYYKQLKPDIRLGISVPATFSRYRVVFSFGLNTHDALTKNQLIHKTETLIEMGRFCLQQIMAAIPFPDKVSD